MKPCLLLLSLLLLSACSRPGQDIPTNELPANALVGTWRLTTYCKSTGASTCTTVNVPANKGVFISFNNAGKYSEFYENTKPVEYAFLGCGGGSYQLESNGDLRIRASCMSSSTGQVYKLISVQNKQLIINPFGSGNYIFTKR